LAKFKRSVQTWYNYLIKASFPQDSLIVHRPVRTDIDVENRQSARQSPSKPASGILVVEAATSHFVNFCTRMCFPSTAPQQLGISTSEEEFGRGCERFGCRRRQNIVFSASMTALKLSE